jgi:hypothetical protein
VTHYKHYVKLIWCNVEVNHATLLVEGLAEYIESLTFVKEVLLKTTMRVFVFCDDVAKVEVLINLC